MTTFTSGLPTLRPVTSRCVVLGFCVLLASPIVGETALRVAPSGPDDALPALDPDLVRARAVYDSEYEAHRRFRSVRFEMGSPFGLLPTDKLGGDPVLNLDSGLGYSSLQAAINAATAGDTLQVTADLAEGPVTVDRNLFIQGLTGAEVVRPTQDTGSSGDARAWFLVDPGVALVVRDLIFDGSGFKIFQAFRHRGLGLFERVHFRNIQFEASGPAYQGTALVAFGDRVDVIDSTFEQIGRVGVLFFGVSVVGAEYRGNVYAGKGDGDFLDYGVEVNGGAVVWLLDSLIYDCRGLASDGSASAGLLATTASGAGTVAVAQSNQLLNNTYGARIGAFAGDTTFALAAFNRFFGNEFGITTGSDLVMDGQNNWWACNGGPGALGCDTASAVGGGSIDSDPWLVLEVPVMPSVKPHGFAPLRARLWRNSDQEDTRALGGVADGIPGLFDPGSLGSVVPASTATLGAELSTLFIAGELEGTSEASLTVDHQTVIRPVAVETGIFCDGFESEDSSAWSLSIP